MAIVAQIKTLAQCVADAAQNDIGSMETWREREREREESGGG